MTVIATSENRDCCTFPRGVYFDYVTLFLDSYGYFLVGKGRYGCVTRINLSELQARTWLQLKQTEESCQS